MWIVCAILIWQHNSADVSIFLSPSPYHKTSIDISCENIFFSFFFFSQFRRWSGYRINLLAVQSDRKSHSSVSQRLIQSQLIIGWKTIPSLPWVRLCDVKALTLEDTTNLSSQIFFDWFVLNSLKLKANWYVSFEMSSTSIFIRSIKGINPK